MHWLAVGALAAPFPAPTVGASVGSGPLLFLQHPTNAPRTERLYVVDPSSDADPLLLWTGSGPRPIPLHRTDAAEVLFARGGQLALLDLRSGEWRNVSTDGRQATVLGEIGGVVVFHERDRGDGGAGYWQAPLRDDPLAGSDPGRLVALDGTTRRTSPWTDVPIEAVVAHDRDGVWAVTARADRGLVKIDASRRAARMLDFDGHWDAHSAQIAISPDDRRAALVVGCGQHHRYEERDIAILDLAGAAPPIVRRGLRIEDFGDGVSSLSPYWINAEVLGVSLAAFDARTGRTLAADEIPRLPPPPAHEERGRFVLSHGRAALDGRVVADVLDADGVQVRDLAASPGGGWVAYVSPTQTVLVADTSVRTALLEGWSYDLVWVGAAPSRH